MMGEGISDMSHADTRDIGNRAKPMPESLFLAQLEANSRFPQSVLDGPMYVFIAHALAEDPSVNLVDLPDFRMTDEQKNTVRSVMGAQHRKHGIDVGEDSGVNEEMVRRYDEILTGFDTDAMAYIRTLVGHPLWGKLGLEESVRSTFAKEGIEDTRTHIVSEQFFSSGTARECLTIFREVLEEAYQSFLDEPVTRLAASYRRSLSGGFRSPELANTYIWDIQDAAQKQIAKRLMERFPQAGAITEADVDFLILSPGQRI